MSLDLIRKAINRHGPYKVLAHKAGVTPGFIGDVYLGRKQASRKVLDALGMEKIVTVTYVWKEDEK